MLFMLDTGIIAGVLSVKILMNTHDFIICGGGMSGLSAAFYLVNSSLRDKKILIIEPTEKNNNDRTWAFWEEGKSAFESIVYRSWNKLNYYNTHGKHKLLNTGVYDYKVIRGIDFYEFTHKELKGFPNVEWCKDFVSEINDEGSKVRVKTSSGNTFSADFVFDSTYKLNLKRPENYNLLQHFKGVVLQTETDFFDPEIPDMMNFGIEQKNGECRFVYILPFDRRTALVEYTLFTENLLTPEQYVNDLLGYINHVLKPPSYKIIEDEFGVIPMSDEYVEEFPSPRVVRIGTAGGHTNPATGYTFNNTQYRLERIVGKLAESGSPQIKTTWWQKRHLFYASVLLNVLKNKRYPIGDVFGQMYERNATETVFRFLDGKTNLLEELKIMYSTPIYHFGAAAIDTVRRNIIRLF